MSIPGRSAIHMVLHRFGIDSPDSQTSVREREMLQKYAEDKSRLVEIGVYEGLNTRLIVEKLQPGSKLYAIDPFLRGRLPICWSELVAKRHLSRSTHGHLVEFVKAYSYQATDIISGDLDFIFIDGDHSLEGITQDWADWAPRVTTGGIMALHDTRDSDHDPLVVNHGSYQYYQSHIQYDDRYTLIDYVDSLSILQRVK